MEVEIILYIQILYGVAAIPPMVASQMDNPVLVRHHIIDHNVSMPMQRFVSLLLFIVIAAAPSAMAQLASYNFSVGTGVATDMTSATTFLTGTQGSRNTNKDRASSLLNIGFTFRFGGAGYTQFTISSNGLLSLGATPVTSSSDNLLGGSPTYPVIAPFWDDLGMGAGQNGACAHPKISYLLSGTAPNRLLTVEWKDVDVYWNSSSKPNSYGAFQARLYEGSGKIELYYGRMSACDVCGSGTGCFNTSASIGIARNSGDFMSVTPGAAGSATMSTSAANNGFNLNSVAIPTGTLYTFSPCMLVPTGRTGAGNGGTDAMADGDLLLYGFATPVGSTVTYRPFDLRTSDPACGRAYTLQITGANASEYYFGSPGTASLSASPTAGRIDTIAITFHPAAAGPRRAVLALSDQDGPIASYNLVAQGGRLSYTGNPAKGGTLLMASGDTLLGAMNIALHATGSFTPFTLTNASGGNLPITYTITGGNGQYSIEAGTTLANNQSATPTITFIPTGIGVQPATLVVDAGNGESRTFLLYAGSNAKAGMFKSGNTTIDSTTALFRDQEGCLGEALPSLPLTISNIGTGSFTINGFEVYATDSVLPGGSTRYPLRRDAQGKAVPLADYILTDAPAAGGIQLPKYPLTIAQGESKTLYLTFIGRRSEKRYGAAFLRTTAANFSTADTNGIAVEGLLGFAVLGHGAGAKLSDKSLSGLPKTVVFPSTAIGDSLRFPIYLSNPSLCTLRVSLTGLATLSDDPLEWRIVGLPPRTRIDSATNSLLIPPGTVDSSIIVRFLPRKMGARRGTITLHTNDSSLQGTPKGTFILDLSGSSPSALIVNDLDLKTIPIDVDPAGYGHGTVHVETVSGGSATITSATISGADAADFLSDPAVPWPTLPVVVGSGTPIDLKVIFAPLGGRSAGPRHAFLTLGLSTGDTITSALDGIAGVRHIAVSPASLQFVAAPGSISPPQSVMIRNTGTMPLTLGTPIISSRDGKFTMGSLAKQILDPQDSVALEVRYAPTFVGTTSGTLIIQSDGTNSPVLVSLNGTAAEAGDDRTEDRSIDVVLGDITPNPARGVAEFIYRLARRSEVWVALFDARGEMVRLLETGTREAGTWRVRFDLSRFPAGVYQCRLQSGGMVLDRPVIVVR
ncbi:MAG: C-terminal target protein [Chlorobi bacterium]|nr:C-terminal target protein [Chlorobiota bacterium]